MTLRERARVAVRYTFPSGRGHLSTFLSSLSIVGLIVAIGLLLIVLSVMNGFDKEMRERILSLVPHLTLYAVDEVDDWTPVLERVRRYPGVVEVSPFIETDTLVMLGTVIDTAALVGIDTDDPRTVSRLLGSLDPAALAAFMGNTQGVVLGSGVAEAIGATANRAVTLVLPGARGLTGRSARFEAVDVSAVLHTGTELDQTLVLAHLPLVAQATAQGGAQQGLRIVLEDLFTAPYVARDLAGVAGTDYYATHWMMTHGNLYSAIQLSRDLIGILLFSIIAVAAFNVVSSLVLVVLDKRGDIAILRTLGASGSDIAWIFLMQGALIGVVGVVAGSVAGVLGSLLVPALVGWLEQLLGFHFLNTDVYPVSFVPVDLLPRDIALVGAVAFAMCVLAAIYPARRAARLAPARVLSQDR